MPASKFGNKSIESSYLFRLEDSAMQTQVRQLRGFVSAPAGTDLSQLLKTLKENNIHILDPARFAPGAVKMTDKLIDGIGRADLMVAVLGNETSSGNVLFELGCASALGKKILAIVPEGYEIPSDIKDLTYIRATPSNREAVNFALEQIINAPEQEKSQKSRLFDRSQPLGDLANNLIEKLNGLDAMIPSERNVADVVREMLEASGIKIRMEPSDREIRPDFAVWIDELEPYFGNPIWIEVKTEICTIGHIEFVVKRILHDMSLRNVKAALVFSFRTSSEIVEVASSYPNLFLFDLREFLKRLRQESIGQIVRDERNARVHGRLR